LVKNGVLVDLLVDIICEFGMTGQVNDTLFLLGGKVEEELLAEADRPAVAGYVSD